MHSHLFQLKVIIGPDVELFVLVCFLSFQGEKISIRLNISQEWIQSSNCDSHNVVCGENECDFYFLVPPTSQPYAPAIPLENQFKK